MIEAPVPLTRRRPHCHACSLPMAGHKRQDGGMICPTSVSPSLDCSSGPTPPRSFSPESDSPSLASPPLTPPRRVNPELPADPQPTRGLRFDEPSFTIPETGPWHRRNPNWDSPMLKPVVPPSPVASIVSTVQVDSEGNTVKGSVDGDAWEDDDDTETVSSSTSTIMDRVAKANHRVVSIVAAKRNDLSRFRGSAARRGVFAGLIRFPMNKVRGTRENTWYMVLGRNQDMVNHVIDSQQMIMPGVMQDLDPEGPRMTTFLHLILAGIVGGCVVVYGLSCL